MSGLLITIEGIEGSGKTTILGIILELLEQLAPNAEVLVTAEPTFSNEWGLRANEFLEGRTTSASPWEHAEYFMKDRAFHVEHEILPCLSRNVIVVSDRYLHSQLAYQTSDGLPLEQLIEWNSRFPIPDLMILASLPVDLAMDRIYSRLDAQDLEVYDDAAMLTRIRDVYAEIVEKRILLKDLLLIDTTRPIETIRHLLQEGLAKLLKKP